MRDRLVVVVAGPPCAGKSTLVDRLKWPGDLVADFDVVASGLGSAGKWSHSTSVATAAERRMEALVDEAVGLDAGRAWVIRCAPDGCIRGSLAERLRAHRVLVLKPPLGTLLARARLRPRHDETVRAILRWFDRYTPSDRDELVCDTAAVA